MYTIFWALPYLLGLSEEKQELSVVPIEGWTASYVSVHSPFMPAS